MPFALLVLLNYLTPPCAHARDFTVPCYLLRYVVALRYRVLPRYLAAPSAAVAVDALPPRYVIVVPLLVRTLRYLARVALLPCRRVVTLPLRALLIALPRTCLTPRCLTCYGYVWLLPLRAWAALALQLPFGSAACCLALLPSWITFWIG